MNASAGWTLDELVRRVAAALEGPAYPGAPNGRVREVPDRRAVRWYTTIGLVDRPTLNGRIGLYGTRHLMQIVAVKRRQAAGRSLAQIQAELAGATDDTLRRVGDFGAQTDAERTFARRNRKVPADRVTALAAVPLAGGAVVLLPGRPDNDDLSAIHAAAQPLLDLLADRGLL